MNLKFWQTKHEPEKNVLDYLLRGNKITNQLCYAKFGTTELRKIISRLRKKGYGIRGEKLNGNIYNTYWIEA